MRTKGFTNALRCIFCGRFPLRLEKVDPENPIRLYSDAPLRALQSKLSLSDIVEKDEEVKFPGSFITSGKCSNANYPRYKW